LALGLTVGGFVLKLTIWKKSNVDDDEDEEHHMINNSNTSIKKKKINKRRTLNFEYVAVKKDIGSYIYIYDIYDIYYYILFVFLKTNIENLHIIHSFIYIYNRRK
jgi:hypothetical protein